MPIYMSKRWIKQFYSMSFLRRVTGLICNVAEFIPSSSKHILEYIFTSSGNFIETPDASKAVVSYRHTRLLTLIISI